MYYFEVQVLSFTWIYLTLYMSQLSKLQNYNNSTIKKGLTRYLGRVRTSFRVLQKNNTFYRSTKNLYVSFLFGILSVL